MTAAIHVCRICRERDRARGEDDFVAALAAHLAKLPEGRAFRIVLQDCMGLCAADANLAVTGPGCWGWLFRGLRVDRDLADFIAFLTVFRDAPQGLPDKAARPPGLRGKTAGRLPPPMAGAGDAIGAGVGRTSQRC